MRTSRRGHIATLLADGRVLVAGGWNHPTHHPVEPPRFAEALSDPATGTWQPSCSSTTRWRYAPFATALRDGRVLVAGGYISGGGVTRGAEVFDPATNAGDPPGRWPLRLARSPASPTVASSSCTVPSRRGCSIRPVGGGRRPPGHRRAGGALVLNNGAVLVLEGNPDGIGRGTVRPDPEEHVDANQCSEDRSRTRDPSGRRDRPSHRAGAIGSVRSTNGHLVGRSQATAPA